MIWVSTVLSCHSPARAARDFSGRGCSSAVRVVPEGSAEAGVAKGAHAAVSDDPGQVAHVVPVAEAVKGTGGCGRDVVVEYAETSPGALGVSAQSEQERRVLGAVEALVEAADPLEGRPLDEVQPSGDPEQPARRVHGEAHGHEETGRHALQPHTGGTADVPPRS